jgi:predicted hydrocarbon binding protein
VVDVPYPGYDRGVSNGVYLGILGMFGIEGGKVEQTRCASRGDRSCEFHITW